MNNALVQHSPSWVTRIARGFERDRSRPFLLAWAALIAMVYVATVFDSSFILGDGSFWANPRGPWLLDPDDRFDNVDILGYQVGYLGFLKAAWQLPVFFVPNLGAPDGTNIIFVDATPIVALLGKLVSGAMGHAVNPYGVWTAACFILSAVFASMVVIELGQASLLAVTAASLLALSAPPLLHRFGHLPLHAHFIVIGALLLYLMDRRTEPAWRPTARWAGWLCLAILTNVYLFAMAAALYGASLLRRLDLNGWRVRTMLREPAVVAGALALVALLAGHLGKGTSTGYPGTVGYGHYSMNLASPFWPQRSGLFPGLYPIIDATGGQYEGFNYLGFGAILLFVAAMLLNIRQLQKHTGAHLYLCLVLFILAAFAVTPRAFFFHIHVAGYLGSAAVVLLGMAVLIPPPWLRPHRQLVVLLAALVAVGSLTALAAWFGGFRDEIKTTVVDLAGRLAILLGIFRSSGRMFWPAFYAMMLIGLALALRRLPPGARTAFVLGCCVLQLADTEPLRQRITELTRRDVPPLIDGGEWQARMRAATFVQVTPQMLCATGAIVTLLNMELQLAAMASERPINSVYNPRRRVDCAAEAAAVLAGPWRDDTLYVFATGTRTGIPAGWQPGGLACQPFKQGIWCLGPRPDARQQPSAGSGGG